MYALVAVSAVLVVISIGSTCMAVKTSMVVVDRGTATAHRVELGQDLTDYNVTSYNIPVLSDLIDMDYDFIDDRLYILSGWIDPKLTSVFVNGTGQRHVKSLDHVSYTVAIDPREKIVFTSLLMDGIRNKPSRIVAMATDGTNYQILEERRFEASHLGVDYMTKTLYWSEYGLCSCLYTMDYEGEPGNLSVTMETLRNDLYLKTSPFGIDYRRGFVYGYDSQNLDKYSIAEVNIPRESISRFPFRSAYFETVYDPKTERLFIVNNEASSNVSVYSTNGTHLGDIAWLNLTNDEEKIVRINPL